ncbi:MAG: ornithine carbamoyltransferase [Pirellulales bacterium]
MRHILDLFELTSAEVETVLDFSARLKTNFQRGIRQPLLPGRVMALLFEKPSLRTRVSFETAIMHLGGNTLFLGADVGWGKREPTSDFARVLSSYVDVIVVRAFRHSDVEELASYSSCPVVNGLTDLAHPCQALADLLTLREIHGPVAGLRLAYVGDANNVAASLAVACGKLGVEFAIASPPGYQFPPAFLRRLADTVPQAVIQQTTDPREAVQGAHAIYTDVWTSMGQEAEHATRTKAFAGYQVDGRLLALARPGACFLHCLPAHRGEEVAAAVIDGPQSAVLRQAENRMHAQKGLLAWLLGAQVS